uniref:Ferrous iron transport protein A n=1 Tax=Candidatus Kentrum sp. LFY TaxID=2126342 RepID=A0A450U9N1_9GAMM|nr:MAG: ferrous iron transport protein A [Candidatus Kentron sp. LFY]VFJ96175.1 MAG: ferrous iron transport protein A [Candidatus Kentron sp. LFY]VFK12563.1 MAG: ferrous iron transport protein A [Candidatus Kentron sp. LFY]
MSGNLGELAIGTQGRVIGYEKEAKAYRRRLMAMGLTPSTEFKVIRRAPLGDPMEITVRGYSLSLRKQEASAILVQRL